MTPADTPLDDLTWSRSASGLDIRTTYRGLHLSVWRRPQGGAYQFTISGSLPASMTTGAAAMTFVWQRVLRHIDAR